jgi:hypothetical protein
MAFGIDDRAAIGSDHRVVQGVVLLADQIHLLGKIGPCLVKSAVAVEIDETIRDAEQDKPDTGVIRRVDRLNEIVLLKIVDADLSVEGRTDQELAVRIE